jgi:hypothetical protein
VTETKPLNRSKFPSPFTTDTEPLFPAPPTTFLNFSLRLYRSVWLRAKRIERAYKEHIAYLGGTGRYSPLPGLFGEFHVVAAEPEWVPLPRENHDKDTGMWRRTVDFISVMTFECPPSFIGQIIRNQVGCRFLAHLTLNTHIEQYFLRLQIPFPGLTNNLLSDCFINLNSGVGCAPPPFTSTDFGTNYTGESSVDLPPYDEL